MTSPPPSRATLHTPPSVPGWVLDPSGPRTAGLAAAGVVAVSMLLAWGVAVAHWEHEAQQARQALAEQSALRLHDWVGSRMLVLESIRAMRSQGLIVDASAWRTWVGLDLEAIDGFQAINWLDADGVVRVTAPAQGNESALGKRIEDHPIAGPVFAMAQQTRKMQASPPLDLFQGGRAFTIYLPVTPLDGSPSGYVNGVFRVDRIVDNALDHIDRDQHQVVLRDGPDLLWATTQAALHQPTIGLASLVVGEREWTVEIGAALPVVLPSRHASAIFVIVLAAAAAGTTVSWSAQQARQAAAARAEASRMAHRLAEVERMESLGRVAGGIAHDFNNILTVVIGRASELELRLASAPADIREGVHGILDAGGRAAKLIDMLLTFARRGEEVSGEVEAVAHLQRMAPMLRHLAGRRVKVEIEVDIEHAVLPLTPAAFDRLVLNLVTNAVEAITDLGVVQVRLTRLDEGLCLSVHDDGAGMTAEQRAHIFEPFYTTKQTGTGLGLATVFGLVTQAGGRLEIETAPGSGSRFRVIFPDASGDAGSPQTGSPQTGSPQTGSPQTGSPQSKQTS